MNSMLDAFGLYGLAWSPWSVPYVFLTGVSAAGFFLSLPGLVFRRRDWRSVSRRALLTALVCGLAAPLVLLAGPPPPGRLLNVDMYPDPGAWTNWGLFFITLYLFGLCFYAWLCQRPLLAGCAGAAGSGRRRRRFYAALAYGGHYNAGAVLAAAVLAALGAVLLLFFNLVEAMGHARTVSSGALGPLLLVAAALSGALGMTALQKVDTGRDASALLLTRGLARSQGAVLVLLAVWAGFALVGGAPVDARMAGRGALGWLIIAFLLTGVAMLILRQKDSYPTPPVVAALLTLGSAWIVHRIVLHGVPATSMAGKAFRFHALDMLSNGILGAIASAGLCVVIYLLLTSFVPWDEPVARDMRPEPGVDL